MRLSLRLTVPAEVAARAAAEISEGPLASLGPGTLVDACVVGLVPAEQPDRVVVRVTHFFSREEADGGRVVWARHPVQAPTDVDDAAGEDAAAAEDGVLAELPLIQLSDCRPVAGSADAAGEEARATLAPGTPLEGLLVLQRLSAKRRVSVAAAAATTSSSSASLGGPPRLLLTAKPLLCAAARAAPDMLPAAVERVHAGQAVVGFVASVTAFGAFVRFLDGCTGLCPRSKWPKQVTEAAAAAGSGEAAVSAGTQAARDYAVGDTVVASVDSVLLPTADEGGGSSSANTTQSRSRFTLTLQTGLVSKALPASYLAAGAPSVVSGDDNDSGAASLAASALRSWLLDDESRRCAAPAGAGVPARSAYPVGARMLARVESVDAESVRLRLPAPPSAMQTASASVGLSAVAVLSGGSPAVQVGQFMRVEVLDALESDVLVELLEAAEPPAVPAATPARGSAKKASKAKPGKDAAALVPALPRHFDVGDISPAASSLKLRLGELVDVTVLAAPAGLGAAAYVPVRLAATPSVVAYAAVSDIIGGPTDPSTLVPGAALRAIVTQLPSATFSAAFAESMAPRARAAAALSGLLLLSAAPALVGLRSAAGASGKRGAGGRGVAVADLVPGMILSAMLRPRGGGAGPSGVGNSGSGGAGQKRRRGSSIGADDAAAAAAAGPTTSGGDAGRSRGSSSRHGSATEGRLPPLHVTLIGVHGRYDARLSAAECVDVLSLGAPAAATATTTAAAGHAALARYFELLSSPPGTIVQVKVAVVARERRQRGGARGGAGGEEGDDAAPSAAGESPELVHRVELTCRAADLALPDLHLASCRPDWCGSAAREEEGVRIAGSDSVIAAAGASATPLSDCAAAAAFGGGPSTLIRGATGVGVVLGVSAADGHLWLGVGGGVHARVSLVDCGSSPDVCDPVTGDLHASSVVAAALQASRIHELHPPGSLAPFVLLDVSAQDRRATAGIRQAVPALAVSLAPPASGKQAAAAAAGKGSKKARGSAAAADSSPTTGLGGFAAAVLRVQSWLNASTAAASTPGRVALAQVIGGVVPQLQKRSDAAAGGPAAGAGATSLRLLLSGLIGARADVTELADRADWTDNPAASFTPGDIVVATVLPPLAAGGSSDEGAYSSTLAVSLRPSVAAVAAKFASGAAEAAPGPSKALAAASAAIVAAETAEATAAARVGAVVSGFVVSSGPKGVFVRIARGLSARVGLSQLSDQYLRDPARVFPTGRLVTGVVTAAAADSGRCEMSLRRAAVKSALAAGGGGSSSSSSAEARAASERRLGWTDLRVGLVLGGQVTKVADYGVFIALDGTDRRLLADGGAADAASGGRKRRRSGGGQGAEAVVPISGLCHISEIDASGVAGASKARGALAGRFSVGDHVRTVIASVDAAAKVISLTLKASAVAAGDLGADDDATAAAVADDDAEASDDDEDDDDEEEEEEEDDDNEDDDDDEDEDSKPAAPAAVASGAATRRGAAAAAPTPRVPASAQASAAQARTAGIFGALLDGDGDGGAPSSTLPFGSSSAASVAAGIWGDAAEGDDEAAGGEGDSEDSEDSGADEEGGAPSASALRRRRKQARAASEVETSRREGLLASGAADANPETAEDFERLAKSHPNSSLVWIKYIAWLAQVRDGGAEKASVGQPSLTLSEGREGLCWALQSHPLLHRWRS